MIDLKKKINELDKSYKVREIDNYYQVYDDK